MPALITWWTQDLTLLAPQAPPPAVAEAGSDLLRRWTEPHRHYHSTRHLVEMFWALEELEEGGAVPSADATLARVTAWFHDAVYDPTAPPGHNEAASAELAGAVLPRLGLSSTAVGRVDTLVRMTASHESDDDDPLTAAFHDADLWILAAPEERYDAYTEQVRAEYAAVPDTAFRAGRAAILTGFAARERLYLTDHAHSSWDAAARANLARELDRLG